MLVLSRRPKEKILFPGINASVEVVSIKPGVVRLGIEAPADVAVLREELAKRMAEWQIPVPPPGTPDADERLHQLEELLRARLKATGAGLGLARLQLRAGQDELAEETLAKLHNGVQRWRRRLEGTPEKAAPETAAPPRQARALLVEDNANERELLAVLLRRSGLHVDTVGDGLDALDYLHERGRPDMVLLDMGLPRCDGPTTVREIRRDPAYAGLKIFAVTGHAPDHFGFGNGPVGIDRWFQKPLNAETLIQDLSQELQGSLCAV